MTAPAAAPVDDPTPRHRRWLGVVAAGAALAGAALVVVGIQGASGSDDGVVLNVPDIVAAAPPTTVPPLDVPAERSAANGGPAPAIGRSSPSVDPPVAEGDNTNGAATAGNPDPNGESAVAPGSPLAAQLGERFSAIPADVEPRPRPVGVEINTIDVTPFPVLDIGLEPDGQMEIPDETEIGWYRYGATAGRPGATVLAAHVSWNGTTGPFAQLGAVEPGDRIAVTLDDGTTRHYEVTERATYGKLELPRERLWRNTGDEELVLITCGGDFNPDLRRYRENIVVYAAPVA
ncbi:MAG: sortase [Actinomycetota bacterium]